MQKDINTGYFSEEEKEIYRKMLERNSVKVPFLYNGDLWKLEKEIDDLQYLFDMAYENNQKVKENEELDRLSQMTTLYLSSVIYDLREYQKELEQYLKYMNLNPKTDSKKKHMKDWYTEFKGEENE